MEDVIVARCPLPMQASRRWSLFAVLDGHGGKFAAEFVADKIAPILAEVRDLLLPLLLCSLQLSFLPVALSVM
jgi:serine/threonine protein phosphatase PrpC